MKKWIRRQAAAGKPLNIHAVMRERPDLLAQAYAGPQPRGWRRCLIDAGVDPYKIVHQHEDYVQCRICGEWRVVLERHLQGSHGTSGDEYFEEFGPDTEVTSEAFRVARFSNKPVFGIKQWEKLWSTHQVTDWILLLHEKGHDLNFFHISQKAKLLESAALRFFQSWDEALRAAGLDPALVRVVPPAREWTRPQVIKELKTFARDTKANPRGLPDYLRSAAMRRFGTLEDAAAVAGVEFEAISPRGGFKSDTVAAVVEAIRGLEGLKGRERRERLDEIYHGNETNRRIAQSHFGSLRQLAIREQIDLRLVAPAVYRDASDVDHDLDLLERQHGRLDVPTVYDGHRRLYNVIRETGWGAERLNTSPRAPLTFPPCNPASGELHDRMILLRQQQKISMPTAAKEAGISTASWGNIESGRNPSAETARLIERLLARHGIRAPRTAKGRR